METKYTLQLTFTTDEGKTSTLSIPNANEATTDFQIKTAMDQIIAANAISTNNGNLVSKEKAVLVKTEQLQLAVN